MSAAPSDHAARAEAEVVRLRMAGEPRALAQALEDLAAEQAKSIDLLAAAAALKEAASLWHRAAEGVREANCLLLAASTLRMAGELEAAAEVLAQLRSGEFPAQLLLAAETEWSEQELAKGQCETARQGFSRVLADLVRQQDTPAYALILQRRAAAAIACNDARAAADDFLQAAALLRSHRALADAETAALAAASVLADVDTAAAERIVADVAQTVPGDGAAAARRGLVGGKVAMHAQKPAVALQRFDEARQGALDAAEPILYLAAAVEAAQAAEAQRDDHTAYARLATAWATLADLLGPEAGREMARPFLAALRDRLGSERFAVAKRSYEAGRHQ